MSGFADVFPDSTAAHLIHTLGDQVRITLADDSEHTLLGAPVTKDMWQEAGGPNAFSDFRAEIEIVAADLPPGTTRADLAPDGTVERLTLTEVPLLKISDVRETGQGIWRLVCEP